MELLNRFWQWCVRLFHQMGTPKFFYEKTSQWIPLLWVVSIGAMLIGVVWGLAYAPPDYQQGNSYRIIFIHVPSAFLAQAVYVFMATAGAVVLIWRIKVAEMVLKACAPFGASMAVLALMTGAIWGKPTWGTYWVWDARLTSMLFLLFLYIGVIALQNSIQNQTTAGRAASILSIVGVVNIPIIKYSVEWWNTLHQPATLKVTEESTMAPEMLVPLLTCIFGFYMFFTLIVILQTRNEILVRESKSKWVRDLVEGKG